MWRPLYPVAVAEVTASEPIEDWHGEDGLTGWSLSLGRVRPVDEETPNG